MQNGTWFTPTMISHWGFVAFHAQNCPIGWKVCVRNPYKNVRSDEVFVMNTGSFDQIKGRIFRADPRLLFQEGLQRIILARPKISTQINLSCDIIPSKYCLIEGCDLSSKASSADGS